VSAARQDGCPLCEGPGGRLVLDTPRWRLVHAQEAGFPAFYRLVWNGHVREFSGLAAEERRECMEALATIEQAMLRLLQPTKVNLASLGNAVPHLHWHAIARFDWDSHFPGAVWAAPQRQPAPGAVARVEALLPALEAEFRTLLASAS
jgi:diadenosine tetraphosphate (Ap4A) HIT family hydrolase